MNTIQKRRLTITISAIIIIVLSILLYGQVRSRQDKQDVVPNRDYTEIINSSGTYTEIEYIAFQKELQREKQSILDKASYRDSVSYYEKGMLSDLELQRELDKTDNFINAIQEKLKTFEVPDYLKINKEEIQNTGNFQ